MEITLLSGLAGVLYGVINGAILAVVRYAAKHNSENPEDFSFTKMLPTLIVGGFIGGYAFASNQDYSVLAGSTMTIGLTYLVQNVIKIVVRKWGDKEHLAEDVE